MKLRSLPTLALVLLSTGCTDSTPVEPSLVAPDAAASTSRADGFPIVYVRSGGAPSEAGAPVVDNFADAVARVAPGGTIRVFDGTYLVEGVQIDKPLTIEPERGARAVIRNEELDGNPSTSAGFVVDGVESGEVVFRGLAFQNVRQFVSVFASRHYDQVLVENCTFATTGHVGGVFGGVSSVPSAKVTVRSSSFTGGSLGVFASGARMDVLNSTFDDHTFSGIQIQQGSSGRVEGNTVTRCGNFGCIRIHNPAGVEVVGNRVENERPRTVQFGIRVFAWEDGTSALVRDNHVVGTGGSGEEHGFEFGIEVSRANVVVAGNRVGGARHGIQFGQVGQGRIEGNTVDPCGSWNCIGVAGGGQDIRITKNELISHLERQTFFGILAEWPAGSGSLAITDNRIAGAAAPSDPRNPSTYELEIGIQIGAWHPGKTGLPQGVPAEVSRNLIQYSAVGVRAFHGGVITGTDNRFDTIFGEVLGAHDLAINGIQRSDILGYVYPLGLSAGGILDVTCNWWGTADGPRNAGSLPEEAYTPWAAEPIANTSVTCG